MLDPPIVLVERATAAYFSWFGRLPGSHMLDTSDLLLVTTRNELDEVDSGVYRARFAADQADARIDFIVSDSQERGAMRLAWWVGPSSEPSDLRPRLTSRQFHHVTGYTGLTLDLAVFESERAPSDLSISEVESDEQLKIWAAIGGELEGNRIRERVKILRERYGAFIFSLGMPLRLYVANWKGAPSGRAALFTGTGVASLHEVHTLRHMQRRGIGRGLTSHMLDRARELGLSVAVAASSEEGLTLYTGLGFHGHRVIDVYRREFT